MVELLPKDAGHDEGHSDIKKPDDLMRELITKLLDELNLKNCIFPINEIKDKIENKEPYQNVFL